jgi:hypothetical protein
MAHHKRKKPKKQTQPQENWGHRPEPDPEPEVSKTGPVGKKHKKPWVVSGRRCSFRKHLDEKRSIYGRYRTEVAANQAMESMQKHDDCWNRQFPSSGYWSNRKYKVEYKGKV